MEQTNSLSTTALPLPIVAEVFESVTQQVPLGAVYASLSNDANDDRAPMPVLLSLPDLELCAAQLDGRYVKVESAGVVRLPSGDLIEIPAAQPDQVGNFVFMPRRGGVSPARNERKQGLLWQRLIEAAQFGQVNAYYHAARMARYINELLVELDAPPLPKLRLLTSAHSGYDPLTGEFRRERVLAGGHYRMRARRYDPTEDRELDTSGEIHLGPGRYFLKRGEPLAAGASRTRRLGGRRYLHQASHNPSIIYHEYAHHVVRHTADFRCNDQRRLMKQSNAKCWLDEGMCDYLTASMLNRADIFRWHRAGLPPRHPRYRNLEPGRSLADFDAAPAADPHYNGTIWATLLWQLRHRLTCEGRATEREFNRIVLRTLLLIGKTGQPNPANCRVIRRANLRGRAALATAARCLLQALQMHGVALKGGERFDALC